MFDQVAVVGATGAVGRIIRELLDQRNFPVGRLRFIASKRSAGSKIKFRDQEITVEELTPDVFKDIDLAIASTPDPLP